jgi:hypothetical protein
MRPPGDARMKHGLREGRIRLRERFNFRRRPVTGAV